ncbi:hypothetical protein Baya_16030 [Bagarius yarrelli]|uniref:Uncharacterized protein n=1 Tax=Bagarius yarrelli TaxID=175774 RepID=A0A556VU50_BAGYA|nr:hypothetical protein Baya_16030 [Bagarius yarrelli]
MENQRQLPQAGGVESKLAASAIQSENNSDVRRETGDSVIATKFRTEENCDVPSKVPRFQYVDFPSLHQCIKQISVPPLEGWLASNPPGKVTAEHSSSPKDKGPKYKYVDYPSLHHCIQQLSVPPLETWSSKATKPSPGRLQTVTVGVQCPSHVIRDRKKYKEMKENRAEQQRRENRGSESTVHVLLPEQAVLQHMQETQSSLTLEKKAHFQKDTNMQQMHFSMISDCVSSSGSGSNQELDKTTDRREKSLRPSVISLVCTERQKHGTQPEERSEKGNSPVKLEQPIDLELIFPIGQRIFTDSVQH